MQHKLMGVSLSSNFTKWSEIIVRYLTGRNKNIGRCFKNWDDKVRHFVLWYPPGITFIGIILTAALSP